jgi:hypothetical protein
MGPIVKAPGISGFTTGPLWGRSRDDAETRGALEALSEYRREAREGLAERASQESVVQCDRADHAQTLRSSDR